MVTMHTSADKAGEEAVRVRQRAARKRKGGDETPGGKQDWKQAGIGKEREVGVTISLIHDRGERVGGVGCMQGEQTVPTRLLFLPPVSPISNGSLQEGAGVCIGGIWDEDPVVIWGQDGDTRRRCCEDHGEPLGSRAPSRYVRVMNR